MIDWNRWIAGLVKVAGSQTSADKQLPASQTQIRDARQLALLGILLQALHVLFGVTAIIGVLVTQTRTRSTEGSVYRSQLRWQFVTFWIGVVGYAMGFYQWATHGNSWLLVLVLLVVFYRIVVSAIYWRAAKTINRVFF